MAINGHVHRAGQVNPARGSEVALRLAAVAVGGGRIAQDLIGARIQEIEVAPVAAQQLGVAPALAAPQRQDLDAPLRIVSQERAALLQHQKLAQRPPTAGGHVDHVHQLAHHDVAPLIPLA